MGQVVTIGLDIAKSMFPVHGIDAEGVIVNDAVADLDSCNTFV